MVLLRPYISWINLGWHCAWLPFADIIQAAILLAPLLQAPSDIRHFVSPPSQSHGSLALRALSNMIDVLWFLFWLLIISRADRRRAESRSWRPVPRAPAHYGGRTYGHLSSTGRWKIDDGERTFQNQSSVYTCASNGTWSCVTASEKKMKKEKTLNGVEEQISCFWPELRCAINSCLHLPTTFVIVNM